MSFQVEKLGGHMAAAVSGLDLNRPADAPTQQALVDVLHGNLVLCIRGQQLAQAMARGQVAQGLHEGDGNGRRLALVGRLEASGGA